MNQTLVSSKYQVVIPKQIRKQAKIKRGQIFNVDLRGKNIILTPLVGGSHQNWKWPQDYIKNLKNPWEGENIEKYLENERNSWDNE